MTIRVFLIIVGLSVAVFSATVPAQDQERAGSEAALLARGWALLANGDAQGAAGVASRVLADHPLSSAALALAVDADLARSGTFAGLDVYERWLGNRTTEEPYALRRIARALLVESSGKQTDPTARLAALQALAADGDWDAADILERSAQSGNLADARALAATGNERAVKMLITQLGSMPGGRGPSISALGDSGSTLAVPALTALLADPSITDRADAAAALGRLGAQDAIPALRALLKDPFPAVRFRAAGALYRLNDPSGLSLLAEASQSEHAAVRMAAAEELSPQPDANWQGLVEGLARDPDPAVRLGAARLIASYNEPLATAVLEELARSDNVGIREAASQVVAERISGDLATLRKLLRHGNVRVRVRAAAQVLAATR